MSSYWWPLGRAAAAPPSTTTAAHTDASITTNAAAGASSSAPSTHPATSAAEMRHLAQTAFHASLEALLVEATKHRSLLVLRDAVQDTRQRHYDPMSLFDTLCIACSLLAERSGSSGSRSFSSASSGTASEGAAHKAPYNNSSSHAASAGVLGGGGNTSNTLGDNARPAASLPGLPPPGAAHHSPSPSSSHALHYRHHGVARSLLLQSIGDVGKLIALGLLPVTQPVGQRVADLVREIAFLPSSSSAAHDSSPTNASGESSAAHLSRFAGAPGPTAQPTSRTPPPHVKDLASVSDATADTPAAGPVELVSDTPVLVRLLQLTASAASACSLGSPALPTLYGVLILFYSGVAPQSMLEATCEATLTHHIHTVLSALRDNRGAAEEGGNHSNSSGNGGSPLFSATSAAGVDAAPFAAQLQGIAFMKDICRLMVGARTRWLQLSARPINAKGEKNPETTAASSVHPAVVPRKANTASSSMAAVTASVVAAAAGAERQQQQQQHHTSRSASLMSTPMTSAIVSAAHRETSLASAGSPHGTASDGGDGGLLPDSPSLSLYATTAAAAVPAIEHVPERLRGFLMRAVTLFFKEQAATSPPQPPTHAKSATAAVREAAALSDSPLYMQCLNDCLFSVALWGMYEMDITVPMQPPPSLFVEVMQQQYTASHSTFVCSLDLFTCTQQLALASVSANLASMSNSAQVLMEAHERLLRRLYRQKKMRGAARSPLQSHTDVGADVLDAYAERLSQAAIVVLTLWRKTLTCSSLLWEMQQLRSSRLGVSASAGGVERPPSVRLVVSSPVSASACGDFSGAAAAAAASSSIFEGRCDDASSSDDDDDNNSDNASDTHEYGSGSDKGRSANRLRGSGGRSGGGNAGQRPPQICGTTGVAEDGRPREALPSGDVNEGRKDNDTVNSPENDTAASQRGTRYRHRPQPLMLARPQAATYLDTSDGAVDAGNYDAHHLSGSHNTNCSSDTRDEDEAVGVGSPRLELAPLARLLVSIANLVMAYIQPPQQPPSTLAPHNTATPMEAALHEGVPASASATLLSVTPPCHSQNYLEDSAMLPAHDASMSLPGITSTAMLAAAAPTRRRHAHRTTPALPFCLSASPQTVYQCLTEAISFMSVFGQYFCQLAEQQSRAVAGKDRVAVEQALRRCSAWFLDVHPYLLRCGALSLRYLRYEEDVQPMVLNSIGFLVQVSCALQLQEQRDAYLSLLVRALRMPDPVVGHLISLSPPSSFVSTTANNAAASANGTPAGSSAARASKGTATALLEALLVLHHHYARREHIVPGSVAAAALHNEAVGDVRELSPTGHSRSRSRFTAAGMSSWGIGWLQRRGRASSTAGSTGRDATTTTTRAPAQQFKTHGGPSLATAAAVRSATLAGGSASPARHDGQDSRTTLSPVTTNLPPAATTTVAPFVAQLASLGWRAPAVQHVVVLAVCRLRHKVTIMKTLHVIANALGAALDGGWALLARGTALTEPLLHSLKRLLTWIEETSVEQEQQEQLLSDALHLRDALRSLCVDNTCRLPYAQLNVFFSGLVNGTASLSPSALEVKKAAGISLSGHSWSAGFDSEEAELDRSTSLPLDELYDWSESTSPYTIAYAHLPRHDPQGCADQWVLSSECLCLSLLAMLPFTEQQPEETSGSSGAVSLAQAGLLQRQRYGAFMRALHLWQLQSDICRYIIDAQHVAQWGTTLVTSVAAHQRVLLACTAEGGQVSPTAGANTETTTASPLMPVSALSEEEMRLMEVTLTTVVGHVASVAAHLCRSAARRRRGGVALGGGRYLARGVVGSSTSNNINNNANVYPLPYQAIQSAALVLTAGPFAAVPLIQTANTLFATPAGTPLPASAGKEGQLPQGSRVNHIGGGAAAAAATAVDAGFLASLLPFVVADAALSDATILNDLQQALQTSSMRNTYAAHHREAGAYTSPNSANPMGSPPPACTISGEGGGGTVLDPLEQLLTSPFAFLDDVYQQWSQPQCVFTVQRRSSSNNKSFGDSKEASSHDEPSATPVTDASWSQQHQHQHQQHPQEATDHNIDDSPTTSPVKPLGVIAPELAAAATVVAEAVPQLLTNAATTVLMDVVKLVQTYGEDIDGAAWEPILSFLQRTATLATAVPTDRPTTTAPQPPTPVRDAGDQRDRKARGKQQDGGGTVSVSSAQTVESLNTAFRALENIQHNHIPRLKVEGLHRLIVCIGAFTVHRIDGGVPGERKLHINLSAVQLLWSTADYLATFGGGSPGNSSCGPAAGINELEAAALTPAQQQDRLWCSLLWQLRNGCLDDRHEVRQSAMQTFFALVQTYGLRFSGVCWRCVLHDVLLPLVEVVSAATTLCATPRPSTPHSPTNTSTIAATANKAAAAAVPADARRETPAAATQDPIVQLLWRHFAEQPTQLEEVRVTIYDAGSRLFVTHYENMQAALQNCARPPLSPPPVSNTQCSSAGYDEAAGNSAARPASPTSVSPAFRGTSSSSSDAGEATRVLEALLLLCGDVCVVVRGTSGEQSAIAAVHALHGLLVEVPGSGLHPYGVHLAWRAMERLLFRGDVPDNRTVAAAEAVAGVSALYAHTAVKQCTLTVVAAIVAAVCDSFRLQRMVAAAASSAGGEGGLNANTTERSMEVDGQVLSTLDKGASHFGGGFSSYFSGWGNKAVGTSRSVRASRYAPQGAPPQYFTRLLVVLQAVAVCHAVVNSYYFPSKPQTTLLEGVAAVWPTLTSREARMLWGEVLLPAFPSAEAVQRFVLQDVTGTSPRDAPTTSSSSQQQQQQQPRIALKDVMPPGSHPSYLSAVMDTMRSLLLLHMGIEPSTAPGAGSVGAITAAASTATASALSAEEHRTRLLFMAPSTVRVTGTLLLLHLASPAVLAGPPRAGGGVAFTLPALFLQECGDLLQFTLWGPVLSRAPASSTRAQGDIDGALDGSMLESRQVSVVGAFDSFLPVTAAAARCRREGVATLCRAFEGLLTSTSTVVRSLDTDTSARTAISPPSSSAAAAPPQQQQQQQQHQSSLISSSPSPAAVPAVIVNVTVPQYIAVALESLDGMVDTLGEVVRLVMEQYEDVACATEAITALSLASTAEGVAMARVAKRSLALLQRWADTFGSNNSSSAIAPAPSTRRSDNEERETPASSGQHRHRADGCAYVEGGGDRRGEGQASRSQLQDVVRASMEARNKAILKQYIDNPDDVSAGALLVDTLHDMLRVAEKDSHIDGDGASGGGWSRERGVAYSLEQWDYVMPELLRLVACCSKDASRTATAVAREKEVRETLSRILVVLHERRCRRQQSQSTAGASTALPQQRRRVSAEEAAEAMSII
jgi:hypothetical protein